MGEFFSINSAWLFLKEEQRKEKKFPIVPNTMMQRTTSENILVLLCCVHCAHFNILSSFSQKQSTNQPKKYRGMFYYTIEKHMQKFRHFWRENNSPDKVTFQGHFCTKPFSYGFQTWPTLKLKMIFPIWRKISSFQIFSLFKDLFIFG